MFMMEEVIHLLLGEELYSHSQKHNGTQWCEPSQDIHEDGCTVSVHLDLIKYTLGYTINGKYCGIAFRDIKPANYRLVVTLRWNEGESEYQFL